MNGLRVSALCMAVAVALATCGTEPSADQGEPRAVVDGQTLPVIELSEPGCDDAGVCAPPPYKIQGRLYEYTCEPVAEHDLRSPIGVVVVGSDFDLVRETVEGDLLAGRRVNACPYMQGDWLSLRPSLDW